MTTRYDYDSLEDPMSDSDGGAKDYLTKQWKSWI